MTTSSLGFASNHFTLGEWEVSFETGELTSAEKVVKLSKTQQVLLQLLSQHYPNAVSRQTIMATLWPDSVVTDESVSRAIADLRKSLGDSSKEAHYLKTISKKGYSLVVVPTPILPRKAVSRQLKLMIMSVSVLLVCIIFYFFSESSTTVKFHQKKFVKSSIGLSGDINRRPQFGHEGRFIIVEKQQGLDVRLWLYDLALGTETLLFPDSPDSFSTGVFSRDGLELAYFRHTTDNATQEQKCVLEVFTFKTQKSRKLGGCDFHRHASLQWFPGNTHILATGFKPKSRTAGLIFVDAFLGKREDLLFPEKNRQGYLFSRISPSGKLIAFIHYDAILDTSKIAIYDRTEQSINYLPTSTLTAQQVTWGKDDTQILFSDSGATNSGLWLFDLTSQEQALLHGEGLIDFDFTPEKEMFAATIEDYSVSIVSQKQAQTELLLNANAKISFLDLSAKSNQLAYVSEQGGQENIWLLDKKTQQNIRITHFLKIKISAIKLSHNGKFLAYLQSEETGSKMVVLDLKQGYQTVYQANQVGSMAWDKNKNTLIYYHGGEQGRLMSIDLDEHQFDEASELTRIDHVHKLELGQSGIIIVQYVTDGPLYKLVPDVVGTLYNSLEKIDLPDSVSNLWGVSGNTITRMTFTNDKLIFHIYNLNGIEIKSQQRIVKGNKYVTDYAYDGQTDEMFLLQLERANFNIVTLSPTSNY